MGMFGAHRDPGTQRSAAAPSDLFTLLGAFPGAGTSPQLDYDASAFEPSAPSLPYDLGSLIPAPPQLANAPASAMRRGAPQPPASASCTLVRPEGSYRAPNAIALFQPRMAEALTSAITALNRQGISPIMTDGYRSQAMQEARRRHPTGARAATGVSGHQVGLSADWGPGSNDPNFDAVSRAMTAAGLANGAHFRNNPDAFHFMLPGTIRNQTPALADACAAAYRRRQR